VKALLILGALPLLLAQYYASQGASGSPVKVGAYGIACRYEDGQVGPPSYSVAAIGKSGVPRLTDDQKSLVDRIVKYVQSPTLRFSFLARSHFVVFDAEANPCNPGPPGYEILNATNEFYEPGDSPQTFGVPSDVAPSPGPWVTKPPY
jgi:hypothetical protein